MDDSLIVSDEIVSDDARAKSNDKAKSNSKEKKLLQQILIKTNLTCKIQNFLFYFPFY